MNSNNGVVLVLALLLLDVNKCAAQLPQLMSQAKIVTEDLTQLLPIMGTKFSTIDVEIQPGDSGERRGAAFRLLSCH